MAEERHPVSVTIKCQTDGFGFDLTAECFVNQIPGLITKLRTAGVTPANSPYVWSGQPAQPVAATTPTCPVHGTLMKPSKHQDGQFYCTAPLGVSPDGKKVYCQEKAHIG